MFRANRLSGQAGKRHNQVRFPAAMRVVGSLVADGQCLADAHRL